MKKPKTKLFPPRNNYRKFTTLDKAAERMGTPVCKINRALALFGYLTDAGYPTAKAYDDRVAAKFWFVHDLVTGKGPKIYSEKLTDNHNVTVSHKVKWHFHRVLEVVIHYTKQTRDNDSDVTEPSNMVKDNNCVQKKKRRRKSKGLVPNMNWKSLEAKARRELKQAGKELETPKKHLPPKRD